MTNINKTYKINPKNITTYKSFTIYKKYGLYTHKHAFTKTSQEFKNIADCKADIDDIHKVAKLLNDIKGGN